MMAGFLFVAALVAAILSYKLPKLGWASCLLGVISAGVAMACGAGLEVLPLGALILALPLFPAKKEEKA